MRTFVPDRFKREMICIKALKIDLKQLYYVPGYLKTEKNV